MATNSYFSTAGFATEQALYEDLVIEAIQMYGNDMIYVPRKKVRMDLLLGEDISSSFEESYPIEMYVENVAGYEGQELFQKFGIEIRDEGTLVVSRARWLADIGTPAGMIRPLEGDLIYVPFSHALFEITTIEHEEPFYQLMNLPVYKLRISLFEYNDEDLDIDGVDTSGIESSGTMVLVLDSSGAFTTGETVTQVQTGATVTGEVISIVGNELTVTHVGSSVEDFRLFVAGIDITSDESLLTRGVVDVAIKDTLYGANTVITDEAHEAIFDSSNPFGEAF